MAEMNAFDRNLAGAFDRLVDHIPGEVDAAAVAHRVAREHPRRRLGSITWGPVAVPRIAWLVVASLLVLALGAVLFAGARRPDRQLPAVVPVVSLAECPAGSDPDAPGPADQARPPLTFASPMAFDRHAGAIVTLVARDGDRAQTWTFDVCTNTWARMSDGPSDGGWHDLVYAAKHDLTITMDSSTRRMWTYDLGSDTWTEAGLAYPGAYVDSRRPRFVYDPLSGLILKASYAKSSTDADLWSADLWSYDVGANTWTEISASGFSDNVLLAYDSAAGRLVAYDWLPSGGTVTRLFDPRQRTWTESAAVTPEIDVNWFTTGHEIAYDEAARQTVILNHGRLIAYDAAADRWTTVLDGAGEGLCPGPRCRYYATTLYDPVNERLVIYGGSYQVPGTDDWVQDDGVLAFDLATRTWTTLLEPTRTEPAG